MPKRRKKEYSIEPVDGENILEYLSSDDPKKFLSAYHTLSKRWDGAVSFNCQMDLGTHSDFEAYAKMKGIELPETFRRAITALYREETQ